MWQTGLVLSVYNFFVCNLLFSLFWGTEQALEMGGIESRRQSESREPLTPDPQDNPPQKKKKKKKAHTLGKQFVIILLILHWWECLCLFLMTNYFANNYSVRSWGRTARPYKWRCSRAPHRWWRSYQEKQEKKVRYINIKD